MTSAVPITSRRDRLRAVVRDDRVRPWVLLAPTLAVVGVLFGGALINAAMRSVRPVRGADATGLTLDAYRSLLADPELPRSLLLTLYLATTSTLVAVVVGIGAALLLRRVAGRSRAVAAVFQLPLPIPHVVGALAVLALLGQSGLLSRVAGATGVIDEAASFPSLVFDPWAIGILVEYAWKEVPFIGIVALAILRSSRVQDHEAAARSLGADTIQRLRHVTLPLVLPGVLAAAAIVFAFTFGAFEVPLLLGRSFPEALPVLAYRRHVDVDLASGPEALALSLLMALVAFACVAAAMVLTRRRVRVG